MALTDASGQVVDRYHYDVWGVPAIDLERVPQPLLYAGYVYDREFHGPGEAAGWYWLSVRHYDPALGRFLQPDPSEQEGTRSYVYCHDDPLDCADPSGLFGWEDVTNAVGDAVGRAFVPLGVGLMGTGILLSGLGALQGMGMDPGSGPDTASLLLAGSALTSAGYNLLTGEGIGGGGEGRLGRIGEDAAGDGKATAASSRTGAGGKGLDQARHQIHVLLSKRQRVPAYRPAEKCC